MEQLPILETVAAIDLDSYLAALPVPEYVEGKLMEDDSHMFYFWLSKYHPEVGVVDGVTLEDLYLKNVIENGMDENVFLQYCEHNKFPLPPTYNEPETPGSFDGLYRKYVAAHRQEKDEQYEAWAGEHGIATNSGAIMRFVDLEGYEYRVRTDTDNRGQIIA